MTDNISTLGFNGEYLDSTLDNYHLGNGYRAYNPATMAFTAPDDMSPFGHGGINPYVYVSCDPINNTDPTGHFAGFLGSIIGIINMVSPLQVPTSLSVAGVEEAVMGTVVNVGVDLATDGLGAVATPVLRTVEGVARSTADDVIENVGQHAIISGTPTSHDTRYMDKLLNWVYEKPENQRDYYSWLHDTTHQIDAPGAIKRTYRPRNEIISSVNEAIHAASNSEDPLRSWEIISSAKGHEGTKRKALMFNYNERLGISGGRMFSFTRTLQRHPSLAREGQLSERLGWKEVWESRYMNDGTYLKSNSTTHGEILSRLIVFSTPL